MKQMSGLVVIALAAIFAVSGCTTTGYVTLQPQCEPVVVPALPLLDRGELWDALGDAQYRELERYINGLWGVVDEQAALIGEVCQYNGPSIGTVIL